MKKSQKEKNQVSQKEKRKNKFAVFDIEANNWINFLCAGIKTESGYIFYDKLKNFVNGIIETGIKEKKLYAHNGGKYDFNFLLREFDKRGLRFEIFISQGRMIFIKVFTDRGNFSLIDSRNFLIGSLEQVSKNLLGIENKKSKLESYENLVINSELKKYLFNDCNILYSCIEEFFRKVETNNFLTIGGLSQGKFFTKFLENKTSFKYKPEFIEEYFREFYFGGKVEIYKQGLIKGNISVFDVNSLYPFIMKNKFFPVGNFIRTKEIKKDLLGLYEIEILTDKYFFDSLIPYKFKGKLFFISVCKGDILKVDSIVINFLIKNKVKFRLIKGGYFEGKEKIFSGFVDYYYNLKNTDKQNSYLWKLILNNLYGKFAQKRIMQTITNKIPENVTKFYDYGRYLAYETKSKSNKIFPEISVYVTSYAREYMHKLILENKKEILYSDTDSLILLNKELKTGDKLGELKKEFTGNEFIAIQPKVYAIKGMDKNKIVFKGFNSENFDFSDYIAYYYSGKNLTEKRIILKNDIKQKFQAIEIEKRVLQISQKREKNRCLTIQEIEQTNQK